MKVLAMETSTSKLGVAIADDDSILAEYRSDSALKHSQESIPAIQKVLKEAGCRLSDMDAFAVSIGPGSFTGLRVGVSVIKGLNLVTRAPVVAVPTLDVIAYNSAGSRIPVCVMVDARKGNVYSCLYKEGKYGIIRIWDHLLISPEELADRIKNEAGETLFSGDGIPAYRNTILKAAWNAKFADEKIWFPDVNTVARLGIERFRNKELEDADTLAPFYMYSRECNVNKHMNYGAKRRNS